MKEDGVFVFMMAVVYILYSSKTDSYYTGSCENIEERLEQHLKKAFQDSYTSKADDWKLFYLINNLEYKQARSIEAHIKKMKSRKYLQNLVLFPEIAEKLIIKYRIEGAGSSR